MRNCIFCHSSNQEVLFYIKTSNFPYKFASCKACNAFGLIPIPSKKQLDKAYNTGYYGEGTAKFNGLVEFIVDRFRSLRAIRAIRNIPARSSILDVGCGSGAFLNFLKRKYKFQLSGLEIEGEAALRAADQNKGFTLYTGFLNVTDFENKKFNLITMYHVFEHLLMPKQDIEKIKEILVHRGKLVISMPNIDSWQARIFKDQWFHLDVPRHLIFFKPKDFKRMMKKEGFEIVKEHYMSWEQNPYGYIQSSLNVLSRQHNFLYEFLKTNNKKSYSKQELFRVVRHFLFAGITLPFFLILDVLESFIKKSATIEYTFIYCPKND